MQKARFYFFIAIGVIIILLVLSKQKPVDDFSPKTYGYINPQNITTAKGEIFNFSLLDQNGNYFELYRQRKYKKIILIAVNPTNGNMPVLSSIDQAINLQRNTDVNYYFIYPGDQLQRSEVEKNAARFKINTAILLDNSQEISRQLGLKNIYDQISINTEDWKKTEAITQTSLTPQINQSVKKDSIAYDFKLNRDFVNEVAPIVQSKCIKCHSANVGKFPPFFDSYEKFKNWNEMAKETVLNGRMPPVGADAFYGDYQDNFELTPQEKKVLLQWFDQKKPNGSIPNDPLKNDSLKYNDQTAYPFIFETGMDKESAIAPGGQMEYGYVQLGGPTPYDIWFGGVEVTSTNPRQLHHEAIMITSQPLSLYRDLGVKKFHITQAKLNRNQDGDIVLYTLRAMRAYEMKHSPGTYFRSQVWGAGKPQPFYFGNNNLAYIPKGYYIIMENHYMGTGKEDTEKTRIKFYGFKTKPKDHQRLHSFTLTTNDFTIPAHNENFKVATPSWEITEDIKFTNFLPHLHMRGSSVKLIAQSKSGENFTIYSAPNFNYGWQTGFIVNLKEPKLIKKGTIVKAECTFDNSQYNPYNPDPSKNVNFGQRLDRTEMCKINTNFVLVDQKSKGIQVFKPINKKIKPQDFYEE